MTDHTPSIPPQPSPLPPPARPRAVVAVLSVLVVLLVGASVLAIVLYVGAKDEHALEVERLDRTTRSVTEAEEALALTESAIDTVTGRISTLEAQNTELHKCADPAKDSIIAARDDDDAALGPAVARAGDNC